MRNPWRDIFLCRQTLIEMLKDRNYAMNQTTQTLTLQQFKLSYPSALTDRNSIKIHLSKADNSSSSVSSQNSLSVHFFDEAKVGLKTLKLALEIFEKQNIAHIILVCKESLSPACKKYILALSIRVEIFYENELLFNVTKHVLVPKHRILCDNEKSKLLTELRCNESQLPLILETDPVIRYHGGRKGEVIEIIRKSETAGEGVYYRIVV